MQRLLCLLALSVCLGHLYAATQEENCLAQVIYYEARNQVFQGKLAVGFVVLNRSHKLGVGVCSVVRQPGQFSWYRNRALRNKRKDPKQWASCTQAAHDILFNADLRDPSRGATAFRRKKDRKFPRHWKVVAVIEDHIFYKQN